MRYYVAHIPHELCKYTCTHCMQGIVCAWVLSSSLVPRPQFLQGHCPAKEARQDLQTRLGPPVQSKDDTLSLPLVLFPVFLEGGSHGEDVVQGDQDTQGTANVLKDSLQTKHNFAKCLRVNAQVAKILNCGSSSSHTRGRNFQAFLFQGKPVPQKLNRISSVAFKGYLSYRYTQS